jgi:hypothetical protein
LMVFTTRGYDTKPCGSGLAREEARKITTISMPFFLNKNETGFRGPEQ